MRCGCNCGCCPGIVGACFPACLCPHHGFCRHLSPCSFITAFVTLFATVIAITKDLPDIEGDKQFGIETFATRMGVR